MLRTLMRGCRPKLLRRRLTWPRRRTSQTLPIFLDKLVNPVGAILISVTMVLIFGT